MQINVSQARKRFSELIRRVEQGEEVIITKRATPVAQLKFIGTTDAGQDFRVGDARTILRFLAANPLPEHARRSHEEIEADIAAERASWE